MYLIKEKRLLTPHVTKMIIDAPLITKHAKPGQFVMIRTDEHGERIPLTIASSDLMDGSITIIFQVVGASTYKLNQLEEGDSILDVAGPLGEPSELGHLKRVILIGGGVGCAILYPIAQTLHQQGCEIDTIIGFRDQSFIFLEDEFINLSSRFTLLTNDGSYGKKGFVTDRLKEILIEDIDYDEVIAIGPIPMMKAVSEMTKPYGIKTIVSMNPIMVDGTGMCGGCRIKVGDTMKFACVDGPEFDGHQVDFDLAIKRNQMYQKDEKKQMDDIKGGFNS